MAVRFTRNPSGKKQVAFLLAAATIICLPSILSGTLTPSGTIIETPAEAAAVLEANGIHNPDLQIVTQQNLQIITGVHPTGYVNMLSSEEIIYIQDFGDELPEYYSAAVLHEYAHIIQKNLVASYSSNSYESYVKLIELNALLSENTPALNPIHDDLETPTVFIGLETNADCIAALLPSQLYIFSYVDNITGCSPHDLATAKSIMEGEWPTPENIKKWEPFIAGQPATETVFVAKSSSKTMGLSNRTKVVQSKAENETE